MTLETGIAVAHGHYLTASLFDSELVDAALYAHGYLEAAP